ncbi:hypothetical protein L2106_11110 [Citrobacter portucalensis]|uniref:Uncharacterized protein n=1 Tax=Citrobacter portucalensis TaxID=1639133 RepID=A0ABZ0H8A6_9ENTR|nr:MULTISPECIES: hypothetical protein [Citrobacter freundii complex]MDE9573960.1 hypothetical protein [Citrobacter portucalensis]MDE9649666.1 hypothetical protein [Citrobacter portucalensis]MEB2741106.1 hypothetical protein [Citrobacter portucalensis]WOH45586.1 hypothetical protein RY846_10685 [Citrobacter portucalensis]
MDAAQSSLDDGKLLIAYSDKSGSTIGLEFSAVASSQATFLMGACSVAASGKQKRIVTSTAMDDTEIIQTATDDGGDNMEKRIAILEVEVSHIKQDVSEIKTAVSKIDTTANSLDKNMAVVLEKLSAIKDSLDKKPSADAVDKKISEAKLAVLLGVPGIIAIGTGLYKAFKHYM